MEIGAFGLSSAPVARAPTTGQQGGWTTYQDLPISTGLVGKEKGRGMHPAPSTQAGPMGCDATHLTLVPGFVLPIIPRACKVW